MNAKDILEKPYGRLVTPDGVDGFVAEIVEFPGCYAVGKTEIEALQELQTTAIDWINTALEQGQEIPEPQSTAGYSGRLVLRMPKGLHQRAANIASREGVSLNSFIVACISEQVGMKTVSRRVSTQFNVVCSNLVALSDNRSLHFYGGGIVQQAFTPVQNKSTLATPPSAPPYLSTQQLRLPHA